MFTTFFALYGGCLSPVLKNTSNTTKSGRALMGHVLMVVLLISSAMAGFAWHSVTSSMTVGITVAVAWFILFSIIDRALMASLDGLVEPFSVPNETMRAKLKRLGWYWFKTIMMYAARLGIIVVIAHFNAKAVNLVIYEPEINAVIAAEKAPAIKAAQEKLASASQTYGKIQTEWETWLINEKNVKQKWVDAGDTAKVAEIQAGIDRKQADYLENIIKNGVEVNAVTQARNELKSTLEAASAPTGLAARDAILTKLGENNPFIPLMYWMFLMIEALAFIIKIFKAPDEYDVAISEYREEKGVRKPPQPQNITPLHAVPPTGT